jgi:hypothetical protein
MQQPLHINDVKKGNIAKEPAACVRLEKQTNRLLSSRLPHPLEPEPVPSCFPIKKLNSGNGFSCKNIKTQLAANNKCNKSSFDFYFVFWRQISESFIS